MYLVTFHHWLLLTCGISTFTEVKDVYWILPPLQLGSIFGDHHLHLHMVLRLSCLGRRGVQQSVSQTAPPAGTLALPGSIYPARDVTGPVSQDCCGSRRLQGGESVAQAARADIHHSERHPAGTAVFGTCASYSGIFSFFFNKKKKKHNFLQNESRELTHHRGRLHTGSRLHAPGRIYRSSTGMLASWRATGTQKRPGASREQRAA